jgi:valyl-tRNA synthetase
MNTDETEPAARPATTEDRWILSRLQRLIGELGGRVDAYDFSRVALELYAFLWSELCDWYLEMIKPRLYEGDEAARATVLHVLEETLALLHPLMPFVTEEIHGFVPGREGLLAVRRFPAADDALIDEGAEREVRAVIEATQGLRRYREELGVPAAERVKARIVVDDVEWAALYERSRETIERLARFELQVSEPDGALGEATVGLPGATADVQVDSEEARGRRGERAKKVRNEIDRSEGKLANVGFVEKAPPELVQQEREKLERYRRELEELES